MTDEEKDLLRILADSKGYVACDGVNRPIAHNLEKAGYADWKGASWGSSFWGVTQKGRDFINAEKVQGRTFTTR